MTGGNRSEQHRRRGPSPDRDDGGLARTGRAAPPGPRGERDQGPQGPQGASSWVRQVIEQGDYRLLDRKARELGLQIVDEGTRTQVRGILGSLRRLERLSGEPRRRELAMLRPRLTYAAARSERLRRIRDVLTEASEVAEERPEERALRVVDLVEAILCYALGGRPEREPAPPRGPKPPRGQGPSHGKEAAPSGSDEAAPAGGEGGEGTSAASDEGTSAGGEGGEGTSAGGEEASASGDARSPDGDEAAPAGGDDDGSTKETHS